MKRFADGGYWSVTPTRPKKSMRTWTLEVDVGEDDRVRITGPAPMTSEDYQRIIIELQRYRHEVVEAEPETPFE